MEIKSFVQKQQRILYFQVPNPHAFSEACFSLTPKVSVFPKEVFLEIGCTEKLFGGEKMLLFNAHKLAEAFHVKPCLVVTDRPEWARAFACEEDMIIPPGKSQERLLTLPIERLSYCGDPVMTENEQKERAYLTSFMRHVGVKTISDFAGLSASAITRRFGKMGVLLHDWVSGKREVVLPLFVPEEKIIEKFDTEEMTSLDVLLGSLEKPLLRISARLHGRGLTVKKLTLRFFLESKEQRERHLILTESKQDAASLQRLIGECLEFTEWQSPLQALEVEVSESERYQMGQLSLFDESEKKNSDLAEYIGRLKARLGEDAVGFPTILPSYLPENSWKNTWPFKEQKEKYPIPNRPLFLFALPRKWRPSQNFRFVHSENIAVEWWNGSQFRKYFVSYNTKGEKLWVFWDVEKCGWFLHGTFD